MYADLIKEKFPQDEANGLYKAPKIPAVRLGKILVKDTRISSPNDVLAMHYFSSMFSGGAILFTAKKCFYDDGAFELEDVKEVQLKGNKLVVMANQQTQFVPHTLSVKNEQVAKTLQRILETISRFDPTAEKILEKTYDPEKYNSAEINWLTLRDEILKTIDYLYDRYNDGKLSMIEYEEKKEELLGRL
ncbi:MAG: hypothetical protein AAFR61_08055 [Bacteroidota bacterium]